MQEWLKILKSINLRHHINRVKENGHFKGAEKHLINPTPFHDKNTEKLGIEGTFSS